MWYSSVLCLLVFKHVLDCHVYLVQNIYDVQSFQSFGLVIVSSIFQSRGYDTRFPSVQCFRCVFSSCVCLISNKDWFNVYYYLVSVPVSSQINMYYPICCYCKRRNNKEIYPIILGLPYLSTQRSIYDIYYAKKKIFSEKWDPVLQALQFSTFLQVYQSNLHVQNYHVLCINPCEHLNSVLLF